VVLLWLVNERTQSSVQPITTPRPLDDEASSASPLGEAAINAVPLPEDAKTPVPFVEVPLTPVPLGELPRMPLLNVPDVLKSEPTTPFFPLEADVLLNFV
jgi:hypothetical protein